MSSDKDCACECPESGTEVKEVPDQVTSECQDESRVRVVKRSVDHLYCSLKSISAEELASRPWLAKPSSGNMASFVIPPDMLGKFVEHSAICDEPDEPTAAEIEVTPVQHFKLLENRSAGNYVSKPIVTEKGDRRKKYVPVPAPVRYLRLTEPSVAIGGNLTVKLCVYGLSRSDLPTRAPISESVEYTVTHQNGCKTVSGDDYVILPFVDNGDSRLVALISSDMGRAVMSMTNIASAPIQQGVKAGTVFDICMGMSSVGPNVFSTPANEEKASAVKIPMLLSDPLKPVMQMPLVSDDMAKIKFVAEVIDSPGDAVVARMTAFNPLFPSPLLTISDFVLECQPNAFERDGQLYIGVVPLAGPKSVLCSPKCTTASDWMSKGDKVPDGVESIYFYDSMHFVCDKEMDDPAIQVTVWKIKQKKQKKIFSGTVQLSKCQEQCHIDMTRIKHGGCRLRFSTVYPAVYSPATSALKDAARQSKWESDYYVMKHDMFPPLSIYMAQQQLASPAEAKFEVLNTCLSTQFADVWIEHYFCPENGFSENFIKKISSAFANSESDGGVIAGLAPTFSPFFLILYKGMVVEEYFNYELLADMFTAFARFVYINSVHSRILTFVKGTGEFLVQLARHFDQKMVHDLICHYIRALRLGESNENGKGNKDMERQLTVFAALFMDAGFLHTLGCDKWATGKLTFVKKNGEEMDIKGAASPYHPLLSLFFSITAMTLKEKCEMETLVVCLRQLAGSLERIRDGTEEGLAVGFFPVVSMMFSYDIVQHMFADFAPIILFVMKQLSFIEATCPGLIQRLFCYHLLLREGRVRFFDFVARVGSGDVMENLTMKTTGLNPLATSMEVAWRATRFLGAVLENGYDKPFAGKPVLLIVKLLWHRGQCYKYYHMLFSGLVSSMSQIGRSLFGKSGNLVNQIMACLVENSQGPDATRSEAIGVMLWMIERERTFSEVHDATCCQISMMFALTRRFIVCHGSGETADIMLWGSETGAQDMSKYERRVEFRSFSDHMPDSMKNAAEMYGKLEKAIHGDENELTDKHFEIKVQRLMAIVDEFAIYPAICADIYDYARQINEKGTCNGQTVDLIAAFVCQWHLSALIADVCTHKDEHIIGLPRDGKASFVAARVKGFDSKDHHASCHMLVLESDKFTDSYFSQCLDKAVDSCVKASMFWFLDNIVDVVFPYLEKRCEHGRLERLHERVAEHFVKKEGSSVIIGKDMAIGFVRAISHGKGLELMVHPQIVRVAPTNNPEYVRSLVEGRLSDISGCQGSGEPVLEVRGDTVIQNVWTKAKRSDILSLNARTFVTQTILYHIEKMTWDQVGAYYDTFKTETPLPACCSISKAESSPRQELTKEVFYREKLEKYAANLVSEIGRFKAIQPPLDINGRAWGRVTNISTMPIMQRVEMIAKEQPAVVQSEKPYYHFVNVVLSGGGPAWKEIPERLRVSIEKVKEAMRAGVETIKFACGDGVAQNTELMERCGQISALLDRPPAVPSSQ